MFTVNYSHQMNRRSMLACGREEEMSTICIIVARWREGDMFTVHYLRQITGRDVYSALFSPDEEKERCLQCIILARWREGGMFTVYYPRQIERWRDVYTVLSPPDGEKEGCLQCIIPAR
jgi:hypothetical protein